MATNPAVRTRGKLTISVKNGYSYNILGNCRYIFFVSNFARKMHLKSARNCYILFIAGQNSSNSYRTVHLTGNSGKGSLLIVTSVMNHELESPPWCYQSINSKIKTKSVKFYFIFTWSVLYWQADMDCVNFLWSNLGDSTGFSIFWMHYKNFNGGKE